MAQTTEPLPMVREPERFHRRQTRLYIVLPFLLVVLLFVGLIVVVASIPERVTLSSVADFILTVLVLCPFWLLCLMPILLLMLVLNYGVFRLYGGSKPRLQRLDELSATLLTKTGLASESLSKRIVDMNDKLAPVMDAMDVFEEPSRMPSVQEESENGEHKSNQLESE